MGPRRRGDAHAGTGHEHEGARRGARGRGGARARGLGVDRCGGVRGRLGVWRVVSGVGRCEVCRVQLLLRVRGPRAGSFLWRPGLPPRVAMVSSTST